MINTGNKCGTFYGKGYHLKRPCVVWDRDGDRCLVDDGEGVRWVPASEVTPRFVASPVDSLANPLRKRHMQQLLPRIKPVRSTPWIDAAIVLSAVLMAAGLLYALGLTASGYFTALAPG